MYRRILVPVDGSTTSNYGLAEAIALAKLTGARLRLIHVVDLLAFAMAGEAAAYMGDTLTTLRDGGKKLLNTARSEAAAAGIEAEVTLRESSEGRVCDLVVEEGKEWQADLIVIGTHGRRGARRLALGSDAELVVRMAPVPVLLVRDPSMAG